MLCLGMIVKNEAHVIERALRSVRPLIKHWVVVDTGSTDGTQQLVKKSMNGIPGNLYERPWKDFSTNRNEAIAIARGRAPYTITLDADDVYVIEEAGSVLQLTHDVYYVRVIHSELEHWRPHIFRSSLHLRYEGVVHEYMVIPPKASGARLAGLRMDIVGGGARSQQQDKFQSDALLLKQAIEKDPTNTRYAFYLAQSWRDAYRCGGKTEHLEHAVDAYTHRATMSGGFDEEIYNSLFEVARGLDMLQRPAEAIVAAYLAAYEIRPSRAEPLFHLARYLRFSDRKAAAVCFARHAASLPLPSDQLWVQRDIYEWWALDEFAVAASYFPELKTEAREANRKLLSVAPEQERERIRTNLKFCE